MSPHFRNRFPGPIAAATVLALTAVVLVAETRPGPGPQSLAEATEIAAARGLSYSYDGPPGGCLIVSEGPVPPRDLGLFPRINNPAHPSWIGMVAIYTDPAVIIWNYDPTCTAAWGKLCVYGDPLVIEKLTGRRP